MSHDEKINRIAIYIDSKDKTSGTTDDFKITLEKEIKRVSRVEVVTVEIPFSFYCTKSTNNTLTWTNNVPTTFSCTVDPGNYDATTFAAALENAMNAQMSGFTVTYNSQTYKLTWANAAQFNLKFSTSTVAPLIGLTADSTLQTSFSSQGTINLSGPNYIIIKSDALTRANAHKSYLSSAQSDVLYKMVVSTGPGSTLIEKNLYPNPINFKLRQTLETIDLQLVDPDGVAIDLNGQRWSLTLLVDVT